MLARLILCWLLSVEPAWAACSIDGVLQGDVVVYNSPGGSQNTSPLTTVAANELIFVIFAGNGGGPTAVTGVTGGGLIFTKRAARSATVPASPSPGCYGPNQFCVLDLEVWTALAPTPLAAQAFTVTATTSGGNMGAILSRFGMVGATTPATPFDPNVSLPTYHQSIAVSANNPQVPGVSTTNANDMIFMFCGGVDSNVLLSCPSNAAAGWSKTGSGGNFFNSFTNYQIGQNQFYQIVSAPLTAATVAAIDSGQTRKNWITIADAIEVTCGAPPPPTPGAIPHVWIHE